ncbi:HEAT repeat domain-containing protein [Halomarina ordinaria]|uniref:HEAT repeat domain-containing protein n=1 Tax=Halomarina ordinaria TaxID=3033939 RepID=A0ABD5U8R2_9EURY|nr:HEAT repeat domain-containing protein [Halomarina sp. PSRA2]
MDDAAPPLPDDLLTLLDDGDVDGASACLDRCRTADAGVRTETLRTLRRVAAERPASLAPLVSPLTPFLTDEERSVRLTAVKLFVVLAEVFPERCVDAVPTLAGRLADDGEFYYVRARSAEALGYVAVECPAEAATPDVLADLRVGLSFDEPEVKEKLAKALAYVALGNPRRLRHLTGSLAAHLDDDAALVRYYLCTALVAVGCDHPGGLVARRDVLVDRLDDGDPFVRGRAAEALGLAARAEGADDWLPVSLLETLTDHEEAFAAERARFALAARADASGEEWPADVGTTEAVRGTVEEAAAAMTAPDGGECPSCGLALPAHGPPTCPRCGSPRPRT